jgi:hypothetical protein
MRKQYQQIQEEKKRSNAQALELEKERAAAREKERIKCDKTCDKGHKYEFRNCKPEYYSGTRCDGCKKGIKSFGQDFYHCKTCRYDLCVACC